MLSVAPGLRSDWSAAFKEQAHEFDRVAVTVAGQIPSSLRGTLYKNGPAKFARGQDRYAHWLDGDGYVTALHIRDGEVTWSGRFVRTEAFEEEDAANAVRYRTTFGTQKRGGILANALDIRLKSPANTNVLPTTDGLLALWEAGPPYKLCMDSLLCAGPSNLGGRLALSPTHGALPGTTGITALDGVLDRAGLLCDALSAHPRYDAPRHCMVAWSWRQELVGDAIEVKLHSLPMTDSKTPPSRNAVRAALTQCAFAPHDMGLSSRSALFLTAPTRVDVGPFIAGLRGPAQCTTFATEALRKGEGSTIHVVDRDGAGVRRYQLDAPFHAVHMANAFEARRACTTDGGSECEELHLLATCWPPREVERMAAEGRDLLGSWEDLQAGDFRGVPNTNLCRFVVDLSCGHVSADVLANGAQLDHPKVHPAFETLDTQYVYATCGAQCADDPSSPFVQPQPTQTFVMVDVHAGEIVDSWHAGARRVVDEAILVAYGSGERDAWLIAPVFDGESQMTSYVILDAANLSSGPVCEITLPTFIPWGLHGAWVDETGVVADLQ